MSGIAEQKQMTHRCGIWYANTQSDLGGSVFRVSWLLSQINRLVCVIIDYCEKTLSVYF